VLSVLISACENPLATMSDMKETTAEMKEITADMNNKMDETNENTGNLGAASRHGFSEDKRDKKRKVLFNPSYYQDMGNTLVDAKVFLLSFEYQIWDGIADTQGLMERERLIVDAIHELHQSLSGTYEALKTKKKYLGMISGDSRMDNMTPLEVAGSDFQEERTFYAIATTLHVIDLLQERAIEQNKARNLDMQEVSLYDVISSALLKEKQGLYLSDADKAVLVKDMKEMSIDLLKARMNFLAALAIKNMIDEEDMTVGEKAQGLLFKLTDGSMGALRLDGKFNQVNSVTRGDILNKLEGAVKTKRLLQEVTGETPKLNADIDSIYRNLKGDFSQSDVSIDSFNQKAMEVDKFNSLREELIQ
tara:strand:+ start:284300 stop:285385 length:1086 start_codon:yes stop_codon:yes gene_type:complete